LAAADCQGRRNCGPDVGCARDDARAVADPLRHGQGRPAAPLIWKGPPPLPNALCGDALDGGHRDGRLRAVSDRHLGRVGFHRDPPCIFPCRPWNHLPPTQEPRSREAVSDAICPLCAHSWGFVCAVANGVASRKHVVSAVCLDGTGAHHIRSLRPSPSGSTAAASLGRTHIVNACTVHAAHYPWEAFFAAAALAALMATRLSPCDLPLPSTPSFGMLAFGCTGLAFFIRRDPN
jgi:hypothetical protein